jgi:hypothetical protein
VIISATATATAAEEEVSNLALQFAVETSSLAHLAWIRVLQQPKRRQVLTARLGKVRALFLLPIPVRQLARLLNPTQT